MWYVEERESFGSGYRTISVSEPLSRAEAKQLRARLIKEGGGSTWFVVQQEIEIKENS